MKIFFLFLIMMFGGGFLNIFFPLWRWHLKYAFHDNAPEPSKDYVTMMKIGGIISIVLGIVFIFIWFW